MKIFRIDRDADRWPDAASAALATPEATPPRVLPARLVADSAIIRNNRPVFIPDFAREGWVVDILPAIHIGRLGKFIPPRFAGRYISSFSLVACVRPEKISVPDALTDSFDGAITVGEELPLPGDREIRLAVRFGPLPARRPGNGGRDLVAAGGDAAAAMEKSVVLDSRQLRADDTVALLSRYATLKSGDIIIPASVGLTFPVILDYSLTASADGLAALSLRLK